MLGNKYMINYKCYIMVELMVLWEIILIRQMNQKSAIFVTIWYFLGKWFKFQAYVGDGCRDVCINNVYEP